MRQLIDNGREFTAIERLIETIHPDESPGYLFDNPRTINEYDAAGRLAVVIERTATGPTTNTVRPAARL